MIKTQLCLIDATAFCYRAFYALKGLSTSLGQPTNAVYGFVNFLNKFLKQENPEYIGVCFDVSRDTFRKREYADYKIQRPPMPEGLSGQIPIIKQIIQAYHIAIYEKAGFEADDLIATLVKKAKASGLNVMVVSSDKDVLQLADEDVVIYNPYKDKGIIYDSEKVEELLGIEPNQVIDFLSLVGDSADNLPSVKGIGEKTAGKLLNDYKSVDNILANLSQIKPDKLQKRLEENVQVILLNRKLIKLKEDVDLCFDLEALKIKKPDYNALYKIFRDLEFKKLLKDFNIEDVSSPVLDSNTYGGEFRVTDNISEFTDAGEIVIAFDKDLLFLMSVEKKIVAEIRDFNPQAKAILMSPQINKIGYNLKEMKVKLAAKNIKLEGLYFDVMIAAYVLNPSRSSYGLADLIWDYFNEVFDVEKGSLDTVCKLIVKLRPVLESELKEKGLDKLFFELEMLLVDVLAVMEINGVSIDLALLKSLSLQGEKKLADLVEKIYEFSGIQFNINSPKQLRCILFERLNLPVQKKTKSGPSTDEEVLNILAKQHPLPRVLLDYRKLMKIKSTYIDTLPNLVNPVTGRVHAAFNQTGTQTGRLSSNNPNLQNLPVKGDIGRQIRKAVVSSGRDFFIVSFDYSQIELRILAHLSNDPQLIEAFKKNQDIHITTASLIYGIDKKDVNDEMREVAKRINFGIIYGLSSYGLSRDLEISQEAADSFISAYFIRYPKVKDYIQSQIEKAQADGYVTTILGRRRYIPEINSKNKGMRQFAERQAVNTPVQGSAADIIKKAMVDIHYQMQELSVKSKLIMQVHDELVFDVFESELEQMADLARKGMEGCFRFCVPIKVVIKKGKNWLETEEI